MGSYLNQGPSSGPRNLASASMITAVPGIRGNACLLNAGLMFPVKSIRSLLSFGVVVGSMGSLWPATCPLGGGDLSGAGSEKVNRLQSLNPKPLTHPFTLNLFPDPPPLANPVFQAQALEKMSSSPAVPNPGSRNNGKPEARHPVP